jgi:hypothetical protein
MKKLLLMIAAVGVLFTACNNKETDVVYDDHSADLVGTWSCLTANYAEVLIINADGSAVSYGVEDGEYWENVKGTVVTEGGNITMKFEDNDNFTGHFDIIPGKSFSLFEDSGERYVYQYCENDLADDIIGMWVSNDGPTDMDNEIQIRTYGKDGIVTTTGVRTIGGNAEWMLNEECQYKVVGDLIFKTRSKEVDGQLKVSHSAERFVYAPKATALGDIINVFFYLPMGDSYVESTVSFLRIKQSLDLANKSYDYNNIYVTNVKGADKEFEIMGYTLNFSTMDGSKLDKMLKSTLFNVEFPDANTIRYSYQHGEQNNVVDVPIVVEGNKLTVKMSTKGSALKDVVYYAFQDVDACQLHLYMHRNTVVDFYTNMQALLDTWTKNEDVINNAAAVNAIYKSFDEAIESINLSIVLKAAK